METTNHEYYVSLEVAKLLKEADFDWKCNGTFISEDGTQYAFIKMDAAWDNNNSKYNQYNISAPTLEVAQRWLREVKGIEVNVLCVYINYDKKYSYAVFEGKYNHERIDEGFDTYEESQESGIKKALELILEKGNENNNNKL